MKKIIISLLLMMCCNGLAGLKTTPWYKSISTSKDLMAFEHPILNELNEHLIMQRLKNIDQSGPNVYFNLTPAFSRYEHSLGVWALVKMAGGSPQEQAAALLHDASHSAFSHLMDLIKGMAEQEDSYQDIIHLDFLKTMGVKNVLRNHSGWQLNDLDPHNTAYSRLERPLPELCADRIQYILFTGWRWNMITQEQMNFVVRNLIFENDTWIVVDKDAALLLGYLSLYFTRSLWGAPWNFALYHYFGEAIKEAIRLKLFTEEEFQYGTDQIILAKLQKSESSVIQKHLTACADIHNAFSIVEDQPYDALLKPKFRGVDPLVLQKGNLIRLTQVDKEYAHEFAATKTYCTQGIGIKFSYN